MLHCKYCRPGKSLSLPLFVINAIQMIVSLRNAEQWQKRFQVNSSSKHLLASIVHQHSFDKPYSVP